MFVNSAKRYLYQNYVSAHTLLRCKSLPGIKIHAPRYGYSTSEKEINIQRQKKRSHKVVVIGGSAVDMYISPTSEQGIIFGRTNEGNIHSSYGGVGRNIAEVLGRLDIHPAFITALGKDAEAENIISYM